MRGTKKANFTFLCIMLYQMALSFVWSFFAYAFPIDISEGANMVLSTVLLSLPPLALYFAITKENLLKTLSLKPLSPVNIALSVLIGVFIQPFGMFLSGVTSVFFPNTSVEIYGEIANQPLWFMILSIGVLPAILEESLLRGVIFYNYRNATPIAACVVTGVLFGLMHMNLQQLLYAAALGVLFAFMVYRTGSIFSSMIAHFTINSTQTLFMYFSGGVTPEQAEYTPTLSESVMTLLSTAFLCVLVTPIVVGLFWLFIRYNDKKNPLPSRAEEIYYNPAPKAADKWFDVCFGLILFFYTAFAVGLQILTYIIGKISGGAA